MVPITKQWILSFFHWKSKITEFASSDMDTDNSLFYVSTCTVFEHTHNSGTYT